MNNRRYATSKEWYRKQVLIRLSEYWEDIGYLNGAIHQTYENPIHWDFLKEVIRDLKGEIKELYGLKAIGRKTRNLLLDHAEALEESITDRDSLKVENRLREMEDEFSDLSVFEQVKNRIQGQPAY